MIVLLQQAQLNTSKKYFSNKMLYVFLFFITLLFFFANFRVNYYQVAWQGRTNFSEAQLLIYLSPLIFCFINEIKSKKNIKYEIIFSLILISFVFISFKRTSLIVVGAALFVYFYLKYVPRRGSKNGRVIFLALSILVIALIVFLNIKTENFFIYRFSIALETGGNGRKKL